MKKNKIINSGSGIAGGEYEIKLIIFYLLKTYQTKDTNFKLGHGLERYLKLDDIILETDDEIILGQAKHKKSGSLNKDDFFKDEGDFSLIVYIDTFRKIFMKDLEELERKLQSQNLVEMHLLFSKMKKTFENGDDMYEEFYRQLILKANDLNDPEILKLLYLFKRYKIHLITNILPSDDLPEFQEKTYFYLNTKEFISFFKETLVNLMNGNLKNKNIKREDLNIPNNFIDSFLSKLQIHIIDDKYLENSIKELMKNLPFCDLKYLKLNYFALLDEIKEWSQNSNQKSLTKLDVEVYFSNFNSKTFTDELKQYENFVNFQIRTEQLVPVMENYALTVVKTSRHSWVMDNLPQKFSDKMRNRVFLVDPDSSLDDQRKLIKDFLQPKYCYYFSPLTDDNAELIPLILDISKKIQRKKKGKQIKEIILFAERHFNFETVENVNIIEDNEIDYDLNMFYTLLFKEESSRRVDNSNNNILTVVNSPRYLLIMTKLQQKWFKQIARHQILFVNPLSSLEIQKCCLKSFAHEKYTHIFCPLIEKNKEIILSKSIELFKQIRNKDLKDYKKIIIFSKENIYEFGAFQNICYIKDITWFSDVKFKMIREPNSMGNLCKCYISRTLMFSLEKFQDERYLLQPPKWPLEKPLLQEEFLKRAIEDDTSIFIISSSPGMGKTSLLTSLACKINNDNKFWAIKIELNKFTDLMSYHSKSKTIPQIEDFLKNLQQNLYMQQTSTINDAIILLVDAVDEVSPDFLDLVVNFLEETAKKVKKIVVTTRGHLRNHLEEKFNVRSFMITEFSSDDICTLISCFSVHSKYAIQGWYNDKISNNLKDFLKIPLHTKMVSDLYFQKDMPLPNDPNLNSAKLYNFYFRRKEEIYKIDKSQHTHSNLAQGRALKAAFQSNLKTCMIIAVQTFFNKEQLKELGVTKKLIGITLDEEFCRMGILEYSSTNKSYVFVHRTFIEYFVAKWCVEILYELDECEPETLKALFKNMLMNNEWKVVRSFIEHDLGENWEQITNSLKLSREKLSNLQLSDSEENWRPLVFDGQPLILKLIYGKSDTMIKIFKFWLDTSPHFVTEKGDFALYLIGEDIKDSKGRTILHYAAEYGQVDLVKLIMNRKYVNIDVEDNEGFTPLHLAIQKDKSEMAEFLISRGGNVNKSCKTGWTSIHFAALSNNINIWKYLVQNRIDIHATINGHYSNRSFLSRENIQGWNSLHIAAYCGHLEFFKLIHCIQNGTQNHFDRVNYLHIAVKMQHFDLVKYIISENICDIREKTSDGWNVLHFAAHSGSLDLVKYFLRFNLKINEKTYDGETVLHLAAKSGNLELLKFFVRSNAKVDEKTTTNENILHYAVQSENLELFKYCILKYLKIEEKTLDNWHDLYFLAESGNVEVEKIIQAGAKKMYETTSKGWSIIHFAARSGNLEIVKYLASLFLINDQKTSDGWTGLHFAAQSGNFDLVKYFLDFALQIDQKTLNGETVADIADRFGYLHLLRKMFVFPQLLDATMSEIFNDTVSGKTDIAIGLLQILQRLEDLDVNSPHYKDDVQQSEQYFNHIYKLYQNNKTYLYHKMIYLHSAIKSRNINFIKIIMRIKCDIYEKLCDDETIVHYSVRTGSEAVLRFLLDNSVDIDAKNSYGETAIDLAAYLGNYKLVKFLRNYKQYYNHYYYSRDFYNYIELYNAAMKGNYKLFKSTYEYIKDRPQKRFKGNNYLQVAVTSGSLKLIQHIVSLNICDMHETSTNGETVMHYAAKTGKLNVVKYFVKRKVNLQQETIDGWTVLHYAVWSGKLETVKYFIDLGFKLEQKTFDGKTAVHFAGSTGNISIIEYLRRLNINLEQKTSNGETVLHFAALSRNLDLVKYLVYLDFDIHKKTYNNESVLHFASFGGNIDIVEYLIMSKINLNERTSDGKTALHYATWNGNLSLVKYLVELGMDIEEKTAEDETPLHFAALSGALDVVQYLYNSNVNVSVKTKNGETVLHYAAESGKLDVVKYFIGLNVDVAIVSKYGKTAYDVAVECDSFEISQHLELKNSSDF